MSINGDARSTLVDLLTKTIELGGSDLHLRVDSPPQVRIHGNLRPLEGYEVLNPEDARSLAVSFLSERQKQEFQTKREIDFSIGIELEGTDDTPYTAAQYRRLGTLLPALAHRYRIGEVAGHSDIAPGRKTDPGPWFDWSRLPRLEGVPR
jgi:hypothetical protein